LPTNEKIVVKIFWFYFIEKIIILKNFHSFSPPRRERKGKKREKEKGERERDESQGQVL
jgi:hypothetical protein